MLIGRIGRRLLELAVTGKPRDGLLPVVLKLSVSEGTKVCALLYFPLACPCRFFAAKMLTGRKLYKAKHELLPLLIGAEMGWTPLRP